MNWYVGEVVSRIQVFVQLVDELAQAADAAAIEAHFQTRQVPDVAFVLLGNVRGRFFDASFAEQVGELDQGRLWSNGAAYIESLDVKPTMIEGARVQ